MTENTQSLMDYIEQSFLEANGGLTEDKAKQLSCMLDDTDKLADALPEVKSLFNENNLRIEKCDNNIKTWQESKKMWKERNDKILLILQKAMESLNLKKFDRNGVKLGIRTTEKYVTDDQAILAQYESHADALRSILPSYIKVSLSVDKTELKNHLKSDVSMMVDHPELVHTEESQSINLR